MKKNYYLLLVCLFLATATGFSQILNNTGSQKSKYQRPDSPVDNIGYWMKMAEDGIVPYNPSIPVKPAEYIGSRVKGDPIDQMSTDVCVWDETTIRQSENSVFIDPDNPQYVLNSNNSDIGGSIYGANYIHSANAGQTWSGSHSGAGGTNHGDPATAIARNGRQFVGFINNSSGQSCAWSDNGTTWNPVVISTTTDLLDKNHLMIDTRASGTYSGYLYSAWTRFQSGHANDTDIEFSRSTNNGTSWSTPINISNAIAAGSHNQGVNIQTGPNGEVYTVWAVYDDWATGVYEEDALGFARSTNGGASFSAATRIHNNIKGTRSWPINDAGKNMRINSFPSMAVDISGGAYNGYIYVVWANMGVPGTNTGTNVSVYCMRSTNGGTSWGIPVRVNQYYAADFASFFPWITCDPVTGRLFCIFYDDRNLGSTSSACEVWVAYSENGGASWSDFRVGDVSFTPSPMSGLASGYFGDYLGISARDGWVYPCWTDNRSGRALTYVSPINFGDNCVATGGCDEYISNVQLGSINNSSACEGYQNFTNLSTNIPVNSSGDLIVTNGNPVYTSDQCGAWVDWNNDGDFTDANESIVVSGTPGVGPYTATIAPPAGTSLGTKTMRIRIMYTGTILPCGNSAFGEVEDYSINVTTALTNVWDGSFNHYWHNANNWSLNHIPTADEPVEIPNVGYQPVAIDFNDEACASLTIQSGVTLNMYDQTLDIGTDLIVNGQIAFVQGAAEYSYINVMGGVFWNSGSTINVTASNSFINVYGDWSFNAGSNANATLGFVDFRGTSDCWIRSYSNNTSAFYNLRIYKSGGAAAKVSNICSDDLVVNNLTYVTTGAIYQSWSNYNLVMKGAFNYYGTFDFTVFGNIGSVVFDGNSQSINNYSSGSGTFNNVVFSSSTGTTLYGTGINVSKNLTINQGYFASNGFDVSVGGNWTNNVGVGGFVPGTGTVTFHSLIGDAQDVVGATTFYNVTQDNTGEYLRFNSNTTVQNDLELHYYCWAYEILNVNGILNLDDPVSKFTSNGPSGNATINSLDQGGTMVCNSVATITVNELVETGIYGKYYVNTDGGVLSLTNSGDNQWVDLNGEIHISGGTMNVTGNVSDWPFAANATIDMSAGVLDFKTCGITINNSSYSLTNNITGGTIRTAGGISGNRADFTPAYGTFECYGPSNAYISQSNGCTIANLSVDKASKGTGAENYSIHVSEGERIDPTINYNSDANLLSLITDFVITNNLNVLSGSLKLNGHQLDVADYANISGNLIMDNAADVWNCDNQITWNPGSTEQISTGVINLGYRMLFNDGSNVQIGNGNVLNFLDSYTAIRNYSVVAEVGNVNLAMPAAGTFYISYTSTYPVHATGDFNVAANNHCYIQEYDLIVDGNMNINSGASVELGSIAGPGYLEVSGNLQNSGTLILDFNESKSKAEVEGEDVSNGTAMASTENNLKSGDMKDETDWFAGEVYNHGHFSQTASGTIEILGGGIFVCDEPTTSLVEVLGAFNMDAGTFEITDNHLKLNAVCSVNGGSIRSGGTFWATIDGNFQPTGGNVTLIGNGSTGQYIQVHPNNYFNDLIIDRSNVIQILSGYNLNIKNDFTILNGGLNTNGMNMYVGGDWTNNVGTDAFLESTGKVVFNGPGPVMQYINSDEQFNILENNTFEAIRINSADVDVVCNGYNWISGGVSVLMGSFTANDLVQNGLYGDWYALSGSEINLYQDASQFVDMLGSTFFINGGMMKVTGGQDESYWCTPNPLDLTITGGGILDFDGWGITIWAAGALNESISGGTLKTSGWLTCYRTDFNPAGTIEFYGGNDNQINIASGSTFENLRINKSSGDKSTLIYNDRDGKAINSSKSNTAYIMADLDVMGNVDIDHGTLIINGYTMNSSGNVNINDGCTLIMIDNSTLALESASEVHVNSGGTLFTVATPTNDALITHITTGYYKLWIENGGFIGAENTIFEYMTQEGVYLRPGSQVDPMYSFHNCTFQNGIAGGRLMTVENSQIFTVNDAVFPINTWGGSYNVYKNINSGSVNFFNASGAFAGQDFEYDPYSHVQWTVTPYNVSLTVFLEGPFNTSTNQMNTNLNSILPLLQPYGTAPLGNPTPDWLYTGSESVGAIPNASVVDWVEVVLRDVTSPGAALPAKTIARQVGFLLNNGSVVALDGVSPLSFNSLISHNLYAVVWHRNHLGVLSAYPLTPVSGGFSYNFSSPAGQAYTSGVAAQKLLATGIYGMRSGDGTGNGMIEMNDKTTVWSVQAGTAGYKEGDYNMNRQVNNPG